MIAAIPSQYFNKKRGLANGLIFAGGGLGGTAITFGLDPLIQKLGLQMAYRVLGIVTLATGLPAAWIMKERTSLPRRKFIEWYVFGPSARQSESIRTFRKHGFTDATTAGKCSSRSTLS